MDKFKFFRPLGLTFTILNMFNYYLQKVIMKSKTITFSSKSLWLNIVHNAMQYKHYSTYISILIQSLILQYMFAANT